MPTDRDYAIATLLGENARDTPQGMGAVLDTIFNRTANPRDYQATGPSIREIVTANNGRQYNNWMPDNAANAITMRALAGRDSVNSGERAAYDRAAQVYDDYVAGNNGYRGLTQGATYYQTPDYADKGTWQNRFYGDNQNYIDVGKHRYTGPQNTFYKDQNAFYQANPKLGGLTSQQAPAPGTDGFGAIVDYSGDDPTNGNFGAFAGALETGDGTGFSGLDASQGGGYVGNGSLGSGIIPNQSIDGFGNGFNVGGGDPGSFGQFNGTMETGDGLGFAGGFNPSAYLAANPDVAAAGVDPLQHWLRYGQAEGRQLTPNANPFTGNANGAPAPISADFSGSPLSPIDPGNPIATPAPITADFGSPLAPVPTGPNVSQGVGAGSFQGTFDPAAYLQANPDVAAAHVDPLTHYLTNGFQEGRAVDAAGDKINKGFDPSAYLQANPDVAAAHADPLQHYLTNGAAEGRGLPTGSNPYSFSNYNVAQGVGPVAPASFSGHFDRNAYLAANPDVAAAQVDPLTHYLTYGYNEGRAIDAAGDKITKGFDPSAYLNANPDVAAAHADPLRQYLEYGAAEGRALPTGGNPYQFSNYNVAQGAGSVANASFNGHFDPNAYLQANPDVAAAHVDPLTHYLTYGFKEGRAIDAQGDKIDQGFDPSAYLNANPDVAAAHADPLRQYLEYGAAEGRALPTGSNPYQFSNYNVAQGLGPTGNGAFGLGSMASGGGYNAPSPYGFSGANVGGGLGATAQSMGSYYPAGNDQGGGLDPYGFSQANVGGFDPNSFGGGAPVEDFGSGAGLGPTQWNDAPQAGGDGGGGASGFNHDASELAFLRGQMDQLAARDATLAASNNANIGFANASAARSGQLDAVGAGNAAKQFAGIQSGLGIAPVAGTSFFTPAPPISFGGIGPIIPPLRAFL